MININEMGFRRMSQSPTTIYLDEDQRKKLFKLAAARNSSFSSEIQAAMDRYVEEKELALSEEEALLLVHQASESIDRMAKALDQKTCEALKEQQMRRALGTRAEMDE